MTGTAELETVLRYHERTKHHFNRFAAGPGAWTGRTSPSRSAAMPARPSRRCRSSPRTFGLRTTIFHAGRGARRAAHAGHARASSNTRSRSAWKQAGATRCAAREPFERHLHPTEGYAFVGGIPELGAPGLFHYAPREHGLERRADCGFIPNTVLVGLSSVYWREAWKYGERAFRYCQHDVGHAIGALRIAAAALGWSARVLDGVGDATVEALLGLDRDADFEGAERESAELLMAIAWRAQARILSRSKS